MKSNSVTAGLVWFASMIGSGATFGTQLLLAKSLEPELYGFFSTRLIELGVISTVSGGAASIFIMHLYSKEGEAANQWIRGTTLYVLCTQTIGVAIILTITLLHDQSLPTQIATLLLVPHMFGQAALDLAVAKDQMTMNYRKVAIWQLLPPAIRISLITLIVNLPATTEEQTIYASVAFGITGLIMLIAGWGNLKDLVKCSWYRPIDRVVERKVEPPTSTVSNCQVIKAILPFGLAGVFYLATAQGNILVTSYLMDRKSAGILNATLVAATALQQLPLIIYQKYLLPKIYEWSNNDMGRVTYLYKNGSKLLFPLGIIVCVILLWAIPKITPILIESGYQESTLALQILSISIPFRYITIGASSIILAVDINLKLRLLTISAALNFSLLVPLITFYGITGAAAAAFLTDLGTMLLFSYQIKKLEKARDFE